MRAPRTAEPFSIERTRFRPKPDSHGFLRLCRANHVQPQRCIMVEDTLDNLRTAARLAARLAPSCAAAPGQTAPLDRSTRPLIQVLAEHIAALTGVRIPEDAWDESVVPEHLRLKVRLVDRDGQTLATSADLIALRREHGTADERAFAHELERDGMTRWDGAPLPERIELERGGIRLYGYPALVDEGNRVAVRVLDSAERAAAAMRAGLCRLLRFALADELRAARPHWPDLDRLRLQYAKAPPRADGAATTAPADLVDELLTLSLARTFLDDLPLPRAPEAFAQRLAARRDRWPAIQREIHALASEILGLYQPLRQRLAALTQPAWQEAARDLREQLDDLVFRGFLQQVPHARLVHYPRYLKAAAQRIDKLPHGRDPALRATLQPLCERWRERQRAAAAAGRDDPRLEEIRWMLEELRVSLFAQQLGTAHPVSVQRVWARWQALGL